MEALTKKRVPHQYQWYWKVFSNKELKQLPLECLWDHTIDLKEGALLMLISRNIYLSQQEQKEL